MSAPPCSAPPGAELHRRGVVRIIVVAADKHEEKNAFLRGQNLALMSTWWSAPTA